MISATDINKMYGKRVHALIRVNLTLHRGKSYALIGPNGSGKTTLIKSILGLVVPSSGEIQFDGEPIRGHWSYREKIGYMPQIGNYPANMRVGQLFDMILNIRKNAVAQDEDLLRSFHLKEIFDKRMHALSGGTRQKVSAALAFLFDPSVLILDEPTAGLDPVSSELLKEKIKSEREKGKLVIITSHIMSDLDDLASDVVYLFEGRVKYDNSVEVLKVATSEERLGRAIAQLINDHKLQTVSV
jgi:Cu-processing system ATP-binding protein